MKEYIIYLKSCECIKGFVTEEVAERILNRFEIFKRGRYKFEDSEGVICVDLERVEAMVFNNIVDSNECGFKVKEADYGL